MSSPKPLNIGMIGYGFMGRAHSNAYSKVNHFFDLEYRPVLKAVCARNAERAQTFADSWGYESIETDWRKLIERDDIDAVDICTPNDLHKEIAIAAAEAGKMILCEKPLARNAAEGAEMVAAIEKAGVINTVWYNYRRLPAVTLAKNLVDEGRLGRIFHYRANFLQDWTISTDLPQGGEGLWRLDAEAAGSGVTGDLLAHCIDTALWINGPITSVTAMTETFIKERVHTATGEVQKVNIDDACAFLARFANGSLAIFESTRYARGHKALYTFEINGENASISWDLHDLHRLQYFDHGDDSIVRGWRNIHVSDSDQPYLDKWWVPGLQIGYEHSFVHQVADFLEGVAKGESISPTFRDAQQTQHVCDAILASAKSGQWVDIPCERTPVNQAPTRSGILAGGNWIIDHVKIVDRFPEQDALASILSESPGTGGSPYNILVDLAKLGAEFPLEGIGLVGDDADGRTILADCERFGIDSAQIGTTSEVGTSHTDVMTVKSTGRRTFFHYRGANALLGEPHFDLTASNARIFHLGYLLLLDTLDEIAADGTTGAARLLRQAEQLGFRTSLDVVSEDSDRFAKIVTPALPYLDYLVVNEFEAGRSSGVEVTVDGEVRFDRLSQAAARLLEEGVREWVVIHCPDGALARSSSGREAIHGSVNVQPGEIAGAAGAGDAFAAGVLLGLHDGHDIVDCLRIGACAAASNLTHPTCTEGILPLDQCLRRGEQRGFRTVE